MTTPRTIPENPKPGERFMRQFNTKRERCWQVEVVQPDGSAALVNSYLSEADARLLVEGQATIDRLTAELAELRAAAGNVLRTKPTQRWAPCTATASEAASETCECFPCMTHRHRKARQVLAAMLANTPE